MSKINIHPLFYTLKIFLTFLLIVDYRITTVDITSLELVFRMSACRQYTQINIKCNAHVLFSNPLESPIILLFCLIDEMIIQFRVLFCPAVLKKNTWYQYWKILYGKFEFIFLYTYVCILIKIVVSLWNRIF